MVDLKPGFFYGNRCLRPLGDGQHYTDKPTEGPDLGSWLKSYLDRLRGLNACANIIEFVVDRRLALLQLNRELKIENEFQSSVQGTGAWICGREPQASSAHSCGVRTGSGV